MNPAFWNIFPGSSRGFSGRIPVGIVPSPIGYKFDSTWVSKDPKNQKELPQFKKSRATKKKSVTYVTPWRVENLWSLRPSGRLI
jgi:hypothetical protein